VSRNPYQVPIVAFVIALVLRLGAIPLSLVQINPYSQGDARGFGATAEIMAQNLLTSEPLFSTPASSTYETWGLFLMPFYLLPGPSTVYAHVFVAGLGALTVYNVAAISQALHSRRAAIAAALPMAVYPSIVLTQGTLLREAAVLCCLTTVARVAIAPGPRISTQARVGLAIVGLAIATALRKENAIVYGLGIVAGVLAWYLQSRRTSWLALGAMGIVTAIVGSTYVSRGLRYLDNLRSVRARGRTEYLGDVSLTSLPMAIGFAPIGAVYFLFAPFPWMVETVADAVVALEGMANLVLFAAGVIGYLQLREHRWSPSVFAVVVAFAVGVVLYGFGTANVGTAVRHRPMFLWVVFVFGGIGFASQIRLRFEPTDLESDTA